MTPSFRLLIDCCRYCYGALNHSELRSRLDGADSDRLVTLARRHRVQGLVWKAARESGANLPQEAQDALREDARRIMGNGLRMAVDAQRLSDRFQAARIPLIFLKGLAVGQLAWGDAFLKTSVDLDILVPEGAIGEAARLLPTLGFEQEYPEPSVDPADWHRRRKESVWRGPHYSLDLHSRLADNRRLIPRISASTKPDLVEVAPGIQLPSLRFPEQVAYLAVHGASSAWFRLKWLADFAALLHPLPTAALTGLRQQAIQLGAGRTIDQALILAHRLFDLPVPAEVEDDVVTRRLVLLAERQSFADREPTGRVLGTAGIHFSQLLLRPGSRYAFGELGRQVGDFLTR